MGSFAWDEAQGCYSFDTGAMSGLLVPCGSYQGIHSLVHKQEGRGRVGHYTKANPAHGVRAGDRPFLLDLYHYLAENLTQGVIGRDMEAAHRISDGSVEIELHPRPSCFIRTQAVYSVTAPETLSPRRTPSGGGLALVSFRHEYNHERPHMALDYRFPIEAHLERTTVPADRHNPPQD